MYKTNIKVSIIKNGADQIKMKALVKDSIRPMSVDTILSSFPDENLARPTPFSFKDLRYTTAVSIPFAATALLFES
ncbi:hypothetical protein HDU82_000575, partial [Entophlyctis luteolus]